MTDNARKADILKFSRTIVNVVDYISFPKQAKAIDLQSDLANEIKNPVGIFLDRHKMELFFVYREELARFKKDLDDKSFKELLESMTSDLKADAYDLLVLTYHIIVIAFYAALAKQNGIATALKTATLVILNTIQHFENSVEESNDLIVDIKHSMVKTAQRMESQKLTASERNTE